MANITFSVGEKPDNRTPVAYRGKMTSNLYFLDKAGNVFQLRPSGELVAREKKEDFSGCSLYEPIYDPVTITISS